MNKEIRYFAQQRIGEYSERERESSTLMARDYKSASDLIVEKQMQERKYVVRRLTPLECNRLQGFPDNWGSVSNIESLPDKDIQFWENVRRVEANICGKVYKPKKSKTQLINWLNRLHTDSAEYKMWGNGIALPCAVDVLSRIVNAMEDNEHENNQM